MAVEKKFSQEEILRIHRLIGDQMPEASKIVAAALSTIRSIELERLGIKTAHLTSAPAIYSGPKQSSITETTQDNHRSNGGHFIALGNETMSQLAHAGFTRKKLQDAGLLYWGHSQSPYEHTTIDYLNIDCFYPALIEALSVKKQSKQSIL
jgi:hypothetical protein